MATTEILAAAATAGDSTTVTLAAGASATLSARIDAVPGDVHILADVQKQGSDSAWYTVAALRRSGTSMVIDAAGTYRVHRRAGADSFGIDVDQ